MRGFRPLGRADLVSTRDYDVSDLLFFSPYEEGGSFRTGGIRGRDFDLFTCQLAIATGACPTDHVFVAVALGEDCFK